MLLKNLWLALIEGKFLELQVEYTAYGFGIRL